MRDASIENLITLSKIILLTRQCALEHKKKSHDPTVNDAHISSHKTICKQFHTIPAHLRFLCT